MSDSPSHSATKGLTGGGIAKVGLEPVFSGKNASCFKLSSETPVCDIVMKGGVTSGVVYPYAILRLAQDFRFSGIGGTSAGAMAAALAAAAEYARLGSGDHKSFSRLEEHCAKLPDILPKLFQPHARHQPAFCLMMAILEVSDRSQDLGRRIAAGLRIIFSPAIMVSGTVLFGALAGGLMTHLPQIMRGFGEGDIDLGFVASLGGLGLASGLLLLGLFILAVIRTTRWPMVWYLGFLALIEIASLGYLGSAALHVLGPSGSAALGGALGMVAGAFLVGDATIGRLRKTDFGLCPGLRQTDSAWPGVTDWLHAAIQDVAARKKGAAPLTFGDIERVSAGTPGPRLALRMITTNLSLRRPYALPEIEGSRGRLGWKPSEWRKLFPEEVIEYLKSVAPTPVSVDEDAIVLLPEGSKLPIVVGARMSLSFPVLFSAVPVYDLSQGNAPQARMLLVDGGLSSNLPLHFFDSLGPPGHPTFAFNLQDAGRAVASEEKVALPAAGGRPPRLRPQRTEKFNEFLSGLLNAAKDWQDNMLSVMPGQFERIVTIRLSPDEGGLNLAMPPKRSRALMRLGYRAGAKLAGDFNLQAHRVRRALVAYCEIERVARHFEENWVNGGMAESLECAVAPVGVRRVWRRAGGKIIARLASVAAWASGFGDSVHDKDFPRPRGSLRITPNLSGDA